jgi:lipoprotein-anchoring transpeptidase ErfK/SrfK
LRARLLGVLLFVLPAAWLAGAATGASTVQVYFVQGEQLVAVARPGSTVEDAVSALLSGPTAAERGQQILTYVPTGTPLRSVTVANGVATVDLGEKFVQGTGSESLLARLSQVVSTATAVPGVETVMVLIKGGVPLGIFPGVNTTVPLTRAALATPNVSPPTPTPSGSIPTLGSTRAIQQRLADLGYLAPEAVDGQFGPATTVAVIAFQKWEGLDRDGQVGPQTQAALDKAARPTPIVQGGPGRRIEVLIDRQLVLAIQGNEVVRAIHVSTGKPSTPTTIGSFQVYSKYERWWSVPFREWLLWAAPFVGGIALHQFPDVPVYAASHGCVRITQYDEPWVFSFVSVGTPVRVLETSR